jgi:hypothetical protein
MYKGKNTAQVQTHDEQPYPRRFLQPQMAALTALPYMVRKAAERRVACAVPPTKDSGSATTFLNRNSSSGSACTGRYTWRAHRQSHNHAPLLVTLHRCNTVRATGIRNCKKHKALAGDCTSHQHQSIAIVVRGTTPCLIEETLKSRMSGERVERASHTHLGGIHQQTGHAGDQVPTTGLAGVELLVAGSQGCTSRTGGRGGRACVQREHASHGGR